MTHNLKAGAAGECDYASKKGYLLTRTQNKNSETKKVNVTPPTISGDESSIPNVTS